MVQNLPILIKTNRTHPLDSLLSSLTITHKLIKPRIPRHNDKIIKPRIPRHNDKIERSYRNDQNRFYSYDDLLKQIKTYFKRSNNIPMQSLN